MIRVPIACAVLALSAWFPSPLLADVEVPFEELPEPVKKTVEVETRGGQITEIEREYEHDREIYEVEYVLEGVKYELDIAPNGTLLRRHRD